MEMNLRNVPFSEELLFFIRRCAGPIPRRLEVRVQRIDVPVQTHEVTILECDDAVIVENDPDVYLAVRNAFARLREREERASIEPLRAAASGEGGVDLRN